MNDNKLCRKAKREVEVRQTQIAANLCCIRNSAIELLRRIEMGEHIQGVEIEFEFNGKLNAAIIAAAESQVLLELIKDDN